jgi:hypothetical protein
VLSLDAQYMQTMRRWWWCGGRAFSMKVACVSPFNARRRLHSSLFTSIRHRDVTTTGNSGAAAVQLLACPSGSGWAGCLCSLRFVATAPAARGDDSFTNSTPVWQRLVRLLTADAYRSFDAQHNGASAAVTGDTPLACAVHAHGVWPTSSHLRRLWMEEYHPAFQHGDRAENSGLKEQSAAAVTMKAPTRPCDAPLLCTSRTYNGCLPEEAEQLPLFVQVLGALSTTLDAVIARRTTAANHDSDAGPAVLLGSDALSVVELCEWVSEVQAVLLYIARHQLRFLIPATFSTAAISRGKAPHVASEVMKASPLHEGAMGVNTGTYDGGRASAPKDLPIESFRAHEDEGAPSSPAPNTALSTATHRDTELQAHPPSLPALRRLSRAKEERLRDTAPPLPPEELLRVTVLVEAARTILDVAHPPPLASTVRAELYTVLLSVVGASEQLSSSALASLTTCLARCVDSYTTRQLLPPLMVCGRSRSGDAAEHIAAKGEAELTCNFAGVHSFPAFHKDDLYCFYRPVCWTPSSPGTAPTVRASAVEKAEAAQLRQHRGGVSLMLRPTEVLQQLVVLANVAQHRIARTLRAIEKEKASQSFAAGLIGSSTAALTPPLLASTVRLAQQERIQEGMLGLLSLQERKARQAAAEVTTAAKYQQRQQKKAGTDRHTPLTAPPRPRRTIAAIQEARRQTETATCPSATDENSVDDNKQHGAAGMAASPATIAGFLQGGVPSTDGETAAQMSRVSSADAANVIDISLTDVAEICGALAAMGYRGGGTAVSMNEPLWMLVADFTCAEIEAVTEARVSESQEAAADAQSRASDATDGTLSVLPGKTSAEVTAVEEMEDAMQHLMQDVRDITFALDRVGCTQGYDQVMALLVRCGFLSVPIPAPSAGASAMRHVPGEAVDDPANGRSE